MADTELEILVEDDPAATATPEGEQAGAAKASALDGAIDPKEGIDKLKADLAESRSQTAAAQARAAEAERRAMAAATDAANKNKEVHESNMALVTNAIETLEAANISAKAAYSAALAAGDHAQAAEINEQMVENHGKLLQLRSGKAHLEEEAKRPPPKPAVATTEDLVEFIASQLTGKSADWVRKHPEYARSKPLWDRVVAADALARSYDLAVDSPEYFAHVEKTLGIEPGEAARVEGDPKPGGRQIAPPAAPGGGQRPPGEEGPRRNVVRLTPQEVEIAENMGMTPQEYAKNKLALQKEGKIA